MNPSLLNLNKIKNMQTITFKLSLITIGYYLQLITENNGRLDVVNKLILLVFVTTL